MGLSYVAVVRSIIEKRNKRGMAQVCFNVSYSTVKDKVGMYLHLITPR